MLNILETNGKVFEHTIDTPKCEYCDKQSHFIVKFKTNDSCRECKDNIEISGNIYLCRLNCKGLYYDVEYGEYSITDYKVNATMLCEKDDCFNCGQRIMYSVECTGVQIKKFPPKQKSIIEINVEDFIKTQLVFDETAKIERGSIIHAYKVYFNNSLTPNVSVRDKKCINRQLSNEFNKKLKSEKNWYIGYKFKFT